jgi:type VI secretion system secreted protein Hcp
MAFDAFLKITEPNIKGESQVKGFEDQIEIRSFHWGVSNNVVFGTGGSGATVGKASAQDLLLTADSSKASPELFIACAAGDHIKEGLLSLRSGGASQTTFATVRLTNVFVVAYDQAGVGESGNPTDEFALRYGKIEFTYNAVKETYDFQTLKKG